MSLLTVLCVLLPAAGTLRAQVRDAVELAVHGPEGALLLVDGQAMGTLPLAVNLKITPGPHRFRLERGTQKSDSDMLSLPANRQAELSLTLTGHSLVAVLRITPGVLLLLDAPGAGAPDTDEIYAAVGAAAKIEHAVLIGRDRQAALLRNQSAVTRCLEQGDCQALPWREGEVAYVISLRIANRPSDGAGCSIVAQIWDSRTREIGGQARETCSPDAAVEVLKQAASTLSRQMLQELARRPRALLAVESVPDKAQVLVDGRGVGVTPLEQEMFAGDRQVEIRREGFLPHRERVQLDPGQPARVRGVLSLAPRAELSRPLARIVAGSILLGGGLLMAGFGTSALLANGQCQDPTQPADICSPYYSTTGVGGGLLGAGAILAVAGTVVLAAPRKGKPAVVANVVRRSPTYLARSH